MGKKDTIIQPLYDNVLIEPAEGEKMLANTKLYLPEQTTKNDNPMIGKVIAVNTEPWYEKDKKIEPHFSFKVGDMVLYRKWTATDLKHKNGKDYVVCNIKDVVCIV